MNPTDTLVRNLQALAASSPGAAAAIAAAAPSDALELFIADDGAISATIRDDSGARRMLASRRQPLDEAERLANTVDIEHAACVVVLGFALGHHVAAIASRMKRTGLVICFEPDVALLRAVLQRVDCTAWLRESNVVLITEPDDAGLISRAVSGLEGVISLGAAIVEHPPSRPRIDASSKVFLGTFTDVMRSIRTNVVTTLMQVETTLRNLLLNLDHYVTCPGVLDLKGACDGRPAIVVSAGPSLQRNLHLLEDPGVRDRFVIIAVQTVLKTLLGRGIRPHFVTALDYHEISRRFYEGLTHEDVRGVTLVAEPKANPAIFDAFPGVIRCIANETLDDVIGPVLARDLGSLPPGATVAHLAYYLARHLACDPVIFIGQDLGFTDGQYYAAGAAIHDVWAPELSSFCTLEMLEWQRIVRSRRTLVQRTDTLGRPIYTDEQMAAYLVQFERDFLSDASRGLTIIDATEGGVAKKHTRSMSLADAFRMHGRDPVALPPVPPESQRDERRIQRLRERLQCVRRGVADLERASVEALDVMHEMREHHDDQARVNALIARVNRIRDRATTIQPAFRLVHHLNQTGALRRIRADRAIALATNASSLDIQKRRIERDISNLEWLRDASSQMREILREAEQSLAGDRYAAQSVANIRVSNPDRRVAALMVVDPDTGALGTPRDISEPLLVDRNPLQCTLARLARCRRIDLAILVTEHPELVRRIVGRPPDHLRVSIAPSPSPLHTERRRAIAAARLWSRHAWRGGIGSLSVFDEICDPEPMLHAMIEHDLDAALLVGPDWAMLDPEINDRIIDRFQECADSAQRAFSQAPPGLAGIAVTRNLIQQLVGIRDRAGHFAHLGATLACIPAAPQPDPIVQRCCAPVDPDIRSLRQRCIPDTELSRVLLTAAIAGHSHDADMLDAVTVARLIAGAAARAAHAPESVTLELCSGRLTSGRRLAWRQGDHPQERQPIPIANAARIISDLAAANGDALLTLDGAGDPLMHPRWEAIVEHARAAGIASIHVRTDLVSGRETVERLARSGVDVISVDLMAVNRATYQDIMGADLFERARDNLLALLELRRGPLATPWIVPRITRCDAVYEQIETFHDHWLMRAGSVVIDPLPRAIPGDRIAPLPLPAACREPPRDLTILCDGSVLPSGSPAIAKRSVANAFDLSLIECWQRAVTHAPSRHTVKPRDFEDIRLEAAA